MALRRGFKALANQHAKELRVELGQKPHESLCPWKLADLLEIPVLTLSSFAKNDPAPVETLLNKCQSEFSAISIFSGRKRLIVHNDAHHPHRQAANIAHELSHAILLHPPTPPFIDGNRNYSKDVADVEDEANWLGPALLISEEAALHIAKSELTYTEASALYNVSEALIRMRINVTGAHKRAAYLSRK